MSTEQALRPLTAMLYDPCGECGGPVAFRGPVRERVADMKKPRRTANRWVLHWRWQCLRVERHGGTFTSESDDQ